MPLKERLWLLGFGVATFVALAFLQTEIQTVHEEVDEVKTFLIQTSERIHYTKVDEECLARNIYYEAGVDTIQGKYSVAQVTLNRLKTRHWGNTICKVVHSPAQFSWTLKDDLDKPKGNHWIESRMVAHSVLKDRIRVLPLQRALMYHAAWIPAPKWVEMRHRIMQVGKHIYYEQGKGSTIAL
jgi:spore germination cell wall hydrolase CwlJ-like protein